MGRAIPPTIFCGPRWGFAVPGVYMPVTATTFLCTREHLRRTRTPNGCSVTGTLTLPLDGIDDKSATLLYVQPCVCAFNQPSCARA